MACTLELENQLWKAGHRCLAGVDEAGRGPLAGPVLTAAVVLPRSFTHTVLTDSKKLSPQTRERLYEELTQSSDIVWASDRAEPREIDAINILAATHASMARAVAKLATTPDLVLIDGLRVPSFPYPQQPLVKGDSLSLSIAAASVIAKVERDRYMIEMADLYPEHVSSSTRATRPASTSNSLKSTAPAPSTAAPSSPSAR